MGRILYRMPPFPRLMRGDYSLQSIQINVSSMGREVFIYAALLLIILDDLWWTNLSFIRVLPCSAKGTSLTQKIPALVQFNLYFR